MIGAKFPHPPSALASSELGPATTPQIPRFISSDQDFPHLGPFCGVHWAHSRDGRCVATLNPELIVDDFSVMSKSVSFPRRGAYRDDPAEVRELEL